MQEEPTKPKETITITVGGNIALRRKELGISQKELALKLGITADAMVRIEKGRIAPKMSRLQDIADILCCSVSFLFRIESDMTDEHAKQIAKIIKPLPTKGQEALLGLIETTAKIMLDKKS